MVAATVLLVVVWFGLMYLFGTGRISMAWAMLAMVTVTAIAIAVMTSAVGPFAQGGWLGLTIFVPIGAVMAYFLLLMAKSWVARWYPHWSV